MCLCSTATSFLFLFFRTQSLFLVFNIFSKNPVVRANFLDCRSPPRPSIYGVARSITVSISHCLYIWGEGGLNIGLFFFFSFRYLKYLTNSPPLWPAHGAECTGFFFFNGILLRVSSTRVFTRKYRKSRGQNKRLRIQHHLRCSCENNNNNKK